jgi:hypothetical protein
MKKRNVSSVVTMAITALAVALILFGSIGATRAAVTHSSTLTQEIGTQEIGLVLNENGKPADTLLKDLIPAGETFSVGKQYDEKLSVSNTGTIDEYVRLTIYKYWLDKDGKPVKKTDLDPSYIELTLGEGWIAAAGKETDERIVLYYTQPLEAGSGVTTDAITKLAVSGELATYAEQTKEVNGKYTTITTTYMYDGYSIGLEAVADGIQTHSAQAAMKTEWGVDASFSGDTLTSVN